MQAICAGAIEYSGGKRLDGTPCTYVRLRILVSGDSLWTEDADADVAACLEANEIGIKGIKKVEACVVARICCATTALHDFEEWRPGMDDDSLRLRTFLNVLGPDGHSIFGKDDCWNTLTLNGQTINELYNYLVAV